jgi:hypothetical protein
MQDGKEMWNTAEAGTKLGDRKSANVMRLYALAQMLAQAESALLVEDEPLALQHLQTLRAHTEQMVSILSMPGDAKVAA